MNSSNGSKGHGTKYRITALLFGIINKDLVD